MPPGGAEPCCCSHCLAEPSLVPAPLPAMHEGVPMKVNFLISTVCLALLSLTTPSWAGEGHDHGEAAPLSSGNGPQRRPDGSVFLPKPAQHQIGVRTLPVS